jgi:hypothetical protein
MDRLLYLLKDIIVSCDLCIIDSLHSLKTSNPIRCEGIIDETLLNSTPFYIDNMWHLHDKNIIKVEFKCNRGHRWSQQLKNKCECGWIQ